MYFPNNFIFCIYITKKKGKTEMLYNPVFHKQASREYTGPLFRVQHHSKFARHTSGDVKP